MFDDVLAMAMKQAGAVTLEGAASVISAGVAKEAERSDAAGGRLLARAAQRHRVCRQVSLRGTRPRWPSSPQMAGTTVATSNTLQPRQ